jgi:hypothetical protein
MVKGPLWTEGLLSDEQVGDVEAAVDGLGTVTAYSGRNMYGTTCLGIVTDDPIKCAMTLAKNLLDMDERELLDALLNTWNRLDSMGKSNAVLYFPRLLMNDDESEDDE